jgi:hypothetical protein
MRWRFSLALSTKHSMDLFIPEPMTLIGWWSREDEAQSSLSAISRGETSGNVHSIWRAMLNGLHLLIVALNQLSGECSQVTEQSSGTVIRFRREVQFGSGSGGGVVVIWTGIPGADCPNRSTGWLQTSNLTRGLPAVLLHRYRSCGMLTLLS